MAGLRDFLFGAGVLKNLAGTPVDDNYQPASVSDAKRNADYAAKRLGTAPAAPAAAAPATVPPKKKKPTAAEQVGTALKGAQ